MGVFKILGNMVANLFIGNLQGNADTATALTSSAGSATKPIYFGDGKPVACTYSLNKTVPSNAVFTDTNTWRPLTDIYPIGSIYMSVNSTSPAFLFGGTWESIKDCFLLAAGDVYAAGSTGGEAAVTLTKDQMPKHGHGVLYKGLTHAYYWHLNYTSYESSGFSTEAESDSGLKQSGGDQPHNNMPPYLSVYVWKRTA